VRRGGWRVAAAGGIAVGALLLAGCVPEPPPLEPTETPTIVPSGLSPETRAALDGLVDDFLATTNAPGLMVGLWTPGGEYVRAAGVADLGTETPLDTDMQFRIGSQTKVLVATLVLQLAGEGRLSLDDPVSAWIDGVPNGDRILIRQLLNHTSGLGDVLRSPAIESRLLSGCAPEDLLSAGAELAPLAEPGAGWHYSNYGYDLLGRIAELAGDEDLATLIEERIAAPLGLSRTLLPDSGNGLSEPFVRGYTASPSAAPEADADATRLPASCLWAAGGAVSTMADLHEWVEAMAKGALVDPKVWAEALAAPVVTPLPAMGPNDFRWYLGPAGFGSFIGHQGGLPGYESASFYSPELDTAVVVLANKQFNAIPPTAFAEELVLAALGPSAGVPIRAGDGMAPMPEAPE